MNIEDGGFDHINMCCRHTVECWYKDNRKYLIEIYETRKIIDIPEW